MFLGLGFTSSRFHLFTSSRLRIRIMKSKHQSEFQMAIQKFWRNRTATLCLTILVVFYLAAVFADFLAPYSYNNENRDYSYCRPMGLHFRNADGRITWPFVYGMKISFNEYHKRVYEEDRQKTYPLKFFVKGR